MRKLIFGLMVFHIIFFTACQKVVDLPVTDAEPQLVINAKYDAIKEEVWVKLSKSVGVFSTSDFPEITGASITITDVNGTITPLVDQGDGTYLLENYTPIYDSEYQLKVSVEGEVYEASDELQNVVALDSLVPEFQEQSAFFESGYVVFMHIADPAGSNFYRVIRKINGEYRNKSNDQFLFDDSFTDGNEQRVPIFSEFYQVDDTVQVELISYSEKSFTYFDELGAIANGASSSAAPANPTSYWSNDCLGHFSAFGYDTKTIVIEE
ncbi:hypothetical protein CW751_03795 [Brumimicrobium salinarum]|uniref:DUF4249 domain-containing protein n=1 Tax=Brumimicrobium salinarum TaxID=2058658 RepID=A0A2I0R536_9FLAO|nr:DUF4249 domain-containing protein [Brumimicrobium salinarum]PKR81659.1 hypothetical protein CW751_03795 [Brumimicrobium salinarum]